MKKSFALWLAAVALMLAAVGHGGLPSAAADEQADAAKRKQAGIKALRKLVEESGLKYEWSSEHSGARIGFSDLEYLDGDTVFAGIPDDNGYYIKMFITVVDKPKEHRFPAAALRESMRLNGRLWLVQLSLDEPQGDIDASIGFDREGVSPQIFKDYVMHLVNTSEDIAKQLKDFVD